MAVNTDLIFPTCIVYGSQVEMSYKVDKNEVSSGAEQRNLVQEYPRHRYNLVMEHFNAKEISQIVRIFHVSSGTHVGFLFLDPLDHTSKEEADGYYSASEISAIDQLLAVSDGSTAAWNVYKYYTYAGAFKRRRIRHIDPDSFVVAVDGVPTTSIVWNPETQQAEWQEGGDPLPAANSVIRCGFQFYVAVRFDMESMGITPRAGYRETVIGDLDNIVLKEILE